MLTLQNISYSHSNKELLFSNIDLAVNAHDKMALIGNNGIGKSTLLKIIAGELPPSGGRLQVDTRPYLVLQNFGQYIHLTIARAIQVEDKLNALNEILKGNAIEKYYTMLNDDWTIENRCKEALVYWQLSSMIIREPWLWSHTMKYF